MFVPSRFKSRTSLCELWAAWKHNTNGAQIAAFTHLIAYASRRQRLPPLQNPRALLAYPAVLEELQRHLKSRSKEGKVWLYCGLRGNRGQRIRDELDSSGRAILEAGPYSFSSDKEVAIGHARRGPSNIVIELPFEPNEILFSDDLCLGHEYREAEFLVWPLNLVGWSDMDRLQIEIGVGGRKPVRVRTRDPHPN